MLLPGLTSVLPHNRDADSGFICAGLREKVPQIARISVWDFPGFGGFQSHIAVKIAASRSGIPQMREYLQQNYYRDNPYYGGGWLSRRGALSRRGIFLFGPFFCPYFTSFCHFFIPPSFKIRSNSNNLTTTIQDIHNCAFYPSYIIIQSDAVT